METDRPLERLTNGELQYKDIKLTPENPFYGASTQTITATALLERPQHSRVAASYSGGFIAVWRLPRTTPCVTMLEERYGQVTALCWYPNKGLLAAYETGHVLLWTSSGHEHVYGVPKREPTSILSMSIILGEEDTIKLETEHGFVVCHLK
jgi:hypothetical protein